MPFFDRLWLHTAWLVWRSGNGVQASPGIYPGHSDLLSLAIPLWAGTMTTGDGFDHLWGRNGEFCVAAGPATSTAGMQS